MRTRKASSASCTAGDRVYADRAACLAIAGLIVMFRRELTRTIVACATPAPGCALRLWFRRRVRRGPLLFRRRSPCLQSRPVRRWQSAPARCAVDAALAFAGLQSSISLLSQRHFFDQPRDDRAARDAAEIVRATPANAMIIATWVIAPPLAYDALRPAARPALARSSHRGTAIKSTAYRSGLRNARCIVAGTPQGSVPGYHLERMPTHAELYRVGADRYVREDQAFDPSPVLLRSRSSHSSRTAARHRTTTTCSWRRRSCTATPGSRGRAPTSTRCRYNGQYYVIEAPMPAFLLLPFVAIFGTLQPNGARGRAWAQSRSARRMNWASVSALRAAINVWICAFLLAGTDLLWCAMLGDVWFIAHVSAVCFTMLALVELAGNRRGWLVALCAGCAIFSRFDLVLALPVYAYLLR